MRNIKLIALTLVVSLVGLTAVASAGGDHHYNKCSTELKVTSQDERYHNQQHDKWDKKKHHKKCEQQKEVCPYNEQIYKDDKNCVEPIPEIPPASPPPSTQPEEPQAETTVDEVVSPQTQEFNEFEGK